MSENDQPISNWICMNRIDNILIMEINEVSEELFPDLKVENVKCQYVNLS